MKHLSRRIISVVLSFAMVFAILPAKTEVVKAATENTVTPGTASKDASGNITFPNLTVTSTGNTIKSISIQFSSAVEETDEINVMVPSELSDKVDILLSPNSNGHEKHVILNAKSNSTVVTDVQWQTMLRNQLSVKLADDDIRKVTFIVDTEVCTRFIEYNYFNGHYYEVVNKDDVTWHEAYSESSIKTFHDMAGYLVTITSKQENDFVTSICNVSTWIGCASDPDYTNGKGYRDKSAGIASFYFTGGDEYGELMCTTKEGGEILSIGSVMKENYTNWDPNNHEPNFRDNGTDGPECYVNMYIGSLWGSKPETWNDLYNNGAGVIDSYVVEYGGILNNGYTMSEKSEVVLNSKYSLEAQDFIITTEEAQALTDAKLKDYGKVSASEEGVGDVTDQVTVVENNILPVSGLYDVEYSIGGEVVKSVNAKVVDKKSENTASSDIAIYANDISLTTDAVASADYKALSGVLAKVISTGEKISNDNITIENNTTVASPGTYEVTFKAVSGTKSETVTVNVTVIEADKVTITANDFIIQKDDYLTAEKAKLKADVSATKGTSVVLPSNISVDYSSATYQIGDVFPVTFGVNGTSATKTVNVTVVGKANVDSLSKIMIGANDFEMGVDELGTTNTKDKMKSYAEVIAKNFDGTARTDITVDDSAVGTTVGATYPVTFTTGTGSNQVSVTVNVTLTQPQGTIVAEDFIVGPNETITADEAKDLANVEATDADGNPVDKDDITVNPQELAAINEASNEGEKGKFPLTYSTPNGKTDTAIVTVKEHKKDNSDTKAPGDDTIVIGANDFIIGVEDYSLLTKENVIKLSNAAAKNVTQGTTVVITNVDTSRVENKAGSYPATLSTADGTSVTITITITEDYKTIGDVDKAAEENEKTGGSTVDSGSAVPADDYSSLTAKDFVIGVGDVITSNSAVDLSVATGTDKKGNPTASIVADAGQLAIINQASKDGLKGKFPLTFTSAEGKTATVTVTIKEEKDDNGSTGEKDKIIIAGNNFIIGKNDYDLLKVKENVIKLSNAVAINETKHTPEEITKADISKVENKPGTYPVTLSTADGTSVTVTVTISDEYATIGDVDKAAEANEETGGSTIKNSTAKKAADTIGPDQLFEKTSPKDISTDIDAGRTVNTVTIDGKPIPSTAYTIKDGKVVINKSYLGKLTNTIHPVVVGYTDGSKRTFNIKVVDFNTATVVKKVPIFKMNKTISVKSKFTLNLVGITKTAKVSFKSSNKKIATVNQKGVITGKKKGKCTVSGYVIQNGAYYKVNVKIKVVKKLKIYNLKSAALSKKSGELPEFNVYKRVFKGKKTKLKFSSVEKDSKISFKSSKKKIATVSKKGVITGKKKGFCVVTATIQQNGKKFVTRVFVRVDDYTKNKQLKKYLK